MRWSRAARDGLTYLVRIDRTPDGDLVVPIRREADVPGCDPLRMLLAEGVDPSLAASCAAPGPIADFVLLAPVVAPQKLIAIGLNYADHARESGLEPPAAPVAFVKTPNSICGPNAPIRYSRRDSVQVDYEAELAVVIGRRARRVDVEAAPDYVFGYTVCNDVSARDAQFADGQWVRGKSFDTFSPLGPWIAAADEVGDPQQLGIRCRVNGVTLQDSTTAQMIFGCAEIISYLSRVMTLEPGDVIATGTPFGVGFARTPPVFLEDGDVVEVEVDRIGTLRNPVIVERDERDSVGT